MAPKLQERNTELVRSEENDISRDLHIIIFHFINFSFYFYFLLFDIEPMCQIVENKTLIVNITGDTTFSFDKHVSHSIKQHTPVFSLKSFKSIL